MIIYPDTEKELTFDDYKRIENSMINGLSIPDLESLQDNLQAALENAQPVKPFPLPDNAIRKGYIYAIIPDAITD